MTITPADSLDLLIARGPPDATDFAKQIAGLPGAYYAGLDEAYKRRTQDAFQNGIPLTPSGQPDFAAMGNTALKAGGVPSIPSAVSLSNLDLQRQKLLYGQSINEQINPPVVPSAPPSTANTLPPPTVPRIPSAGEGQSITGIIAPLFTGPNADRVAAAVSRRFGVDQTQQLTPEQASSVQQYVQQIPRPPQSVAQAPQAPAPPAFGDRFSPAYNGGVPSSVPSVIPSTGGALIPAGRTDAQQLTLIDRALGSGMLEPDQAKALQSQADAIRKNMELTPGGKDYRDYVDQTIKSGRTPLSRDQWETQNKFEQGRAGEQGTIWAKKGEAIAKAGFESTSEIPKLQLAKQLMADPNFYSGPLEKQNETYKSILATIDPSQANAALPQQAFKKVVSDSLRSSIQSLAQAGAGRVQLAEIRILERSAANQANTPAANRLLVELATRAHQQSAAIADLASQYKGGNLDPGFDMAMRNYVKQHPLVNAAELKDPARIAPPIFPSLAAAKAKGIHNSWVESPDGKQFFIP
jgi:hypothetical protein